MAFKWDESNGVSNGPTALHLCTDPGDLGVSKYSGSTCLFGRSRRAESKINRDLANAPRRSAKYMSVPLDVPHGKVNALHSLPGAKKPRGCIPVMTFIRPKQPPTKYEFVSLSSESPA